jgi:hypothetical protein
MKAVFATQAPRLAKTGTLWKDVASALAVLAVVFLNFAHQPAAYAWPWPGDAAFSGSPESADVCGQTGDVGKHAPCHACRIGGGADLPPVPVLAEQVWFGAAKAVYAGLLMSPGPMASFKPGQPRAPPVA